MENEQVKQQFPVGMIFVLIFVGWGILNGILGVLYGLFAGGTRTLYGTLTIVAVMAMVAILGTIFYGIIKRLKWARKLAIGWYVFSMVYRPIVVIPAFLKMKTMNGDTYQKLLTHQFFLVSILAAFIVPWVIQLIVTIYLARKKEFFIH